MTRRYVKILPEEPELALEERIRLAQEAFERDYARCFWFLRRDLVIGERDLPEIARLLRLHGGRHGWLLAARLCPSPKSR